MHAGSWKMSMQVMGLGLLSLSLPGCPMVQDFELESDRADAGSVAARGSYSGSDSTDDDMASDPTEPPSQPKKGDGTQERPPAVNVPEAGAGDLDDEPGSASCPETCSGGCTGARCRIDCIADEECKEAALVCPDGFDCVVSCIGRKSCEKASIECAPEDPCYVLCDAEDGCKDGHIVCGDGDCDLECGSANHACEHAKLICGAGSCTATCASGDALPKLEGCDTAAACQPCD